MILGMLSLEYSIQNELRKEKMSKIWKILKNANY